MKNFKRILAALAALTTLTVSAVSVYAEETAAETEVTEQPADDANVDEAIRVINDYLDKNDFYAWASRDSHFTFTVDMCDKKESEALMAEVEAIAAQYGIDAENIGFYTVYDLYENYTPGIMKAAHLMDKYISADKTDAAARVVGGKSINGYSEYLEIRCLDEKAVNTVKEYADRLDLDKAYIKFRNMTRDEKLDFIDDRLSDLWEEKGLTFRMEQKQSANGEWGIEITVYASHIGEKAVIEKFIAEHGYDMHIPISFNIAGDINAAPDSYVTDLNKIRSMLEDFISKNSVTADTEIYNDTVYIGIGGYDREESTDSDNEHDEKLIRDFMTKSNIDQSKTFIMWNKDIFSGDNVMNSSRPDTNILGDANRDGQKSVRDCAFIAKCLAKGKAERLPDSADYNKDGKKNVRDAAAISKDLAKK